MICSRRQQTGSVFLIGNRTLYGDAFPTLKQLLLDTAKLIPNPNAAEVQAGRETVYDTWLAQVPDRDTYDQPS